MGALHTRRILTPRRFVELAREKKLDPGADELRSVAIRTSMRVESVSRVAGEGDAETFRFVISNESVDRYNSTIALDGWELENYRANPVVMWAHRVYSDPPIGRSVAIEVEKKALVAEVEFVKREVYPFAGMVRDLVEGGFLRAASVSWDPIEWMFNEDRGYYAVDYLKQDLMEWSIVPVPGNPETLAEARAAGVDLDPLAGWAEEQLDHLVGRELSESEQATAFRLEAMRRHAGREARTMVFLSPAEVQAHRAAAEASTPVDRIVAATERLEKAAAQFAEIASARVAPTATADEDEELDGAAIAAAVAAAVTESARQASRELTTKLTGRID